MRALLFGAVLGGGMYASYRAGLATARWYFHHLKSVRRQEQIADAVALSGQRQRQGTAGADKAYTGAKPESIMQSLDGDPSRRLAVSKLSFLQDLGRIRKFVFGLLRPGAPSAARLHTSTYACPAVVFLTIEHDQKHSAFAFLLL